MIQKMKKVIKVQWVRKIGCFFGFHQWITIREEWFLYKQKELYIEHPDYKKQGENIVSVILCPYCNKRVEIQINK